MTNNREELDNLSDKENESFQEPLVEETQTTSQDTANETSAQSSPKKARAWPIWQLSAAFVMAISGSLGFIATASLLKLPSSASCPEIYLPWASASLRLYCAQVKAENSTTENLVAAIKQMQTLPPDHPLRAEVDRNIEAWVAQILYIAETEFQAGKLPEAMAIADKIPQDQKYQNLIDEKKQNWQIIWDKAEKTYQNVQQKLTTKNWNRAFREAVSLTNIENDYWATTKYEETINRIQVAKEEGSKLENAYVFLEKGTLNDLLAAVEEVKTIAPDSYAYKEAQEIITQARNKVVLQVDELIEKQDWSGVSQKLTEIPSQLQLQEEIQDWSALASAGSKSKSGKKEDIEAAITDAEKIDPQRPLYFKAQELINRWRLEIEDVANLQKARDLAKSGEIEDLNAAIAQAQLISIFNPRHEEAESQIKQWTEQIQTIEDTPTLNKAKNLANVGTPNACNEAITQASLIAPGRALYQQAQQIVDKCQYGIQIQQDQPFLDQAVILGKAGDWRGAINAAQQIGRGRALYSRAQGKIATWQNELQAADFLEQAYQASSAKTPEALTQAISLAQKIPNSTQGKKEGVKAMNAWSEELLTIADQVSQSSLEQAISIAKKIPPGTTAFYSAKAKIDIWQRRLTPIPLLPEPTPNN